jgi:prevent-host-death family protein
MAYTVHQAKTHFSRLMREAEAGKEVIVMRGSKPVVKLVPVTPPDAEDELPFRLVGAYRGKMSWTEDAFDPMTDAELIESGLGYMLDTPLVSASDTNPDK